MIAGRTTVYRFFAEDGRLLYVGITGLQILTRLAQHRHDKPWWSEIATATFAHYDTRGEALEIERDAIRAECPAYNVAGAVPRPLAEPIDWGVENAKARDHYEAHRITPLRVKDIAEWLGVEANTVSRKWIHERDLIANPWRKFPEPTWPSSRPLWAERVVEAWAINTGRLCGPPEPGQPGPHRLAAEEDAA